MIYKRSTYTCDGSLAIQAYTDDGEPWVTVTINLSEYNFHPMEGHIFIPTYKMSEETLKTIKDDLIAEVIRDDVPIGYGKGIYAKLRDDWKDIVKEM